MKSPTNFDPSLFEYMMALPTERIREVIDSIEDLLEYRSRTVKLREKNIRIKQEDPEYQDQEKVRTIIDVDEIRQTLNRLKSDYLIGNTRG